MEVTKSNLFRSGGVYTLSTIIEKAIPFLLLPILTRYLSPEDYGMVSMFTVLLALTIPLTGINSQAAIFRIYYKDEIDLPSYIFNSLILLLGSTAVVSLIYLLFSDEISKLFNFPAGWFPYIILASFFQFLVNVILLVWQAENKPLKFGVFGVLLTALNLSLTILFVVGLGYGWRGMAVGKISAFVVFGISAVLFLWNKKLIKIQVVVKYLKHALNYGLPLVPHVISGILLSMLDRVFITNMVGVEETGIYTVGYQIGMIIGVLAGAFNKAWLPWLFEQLKLGNELIKRKIVKLTYLYMILILILAIGLAFLAPWFMKFFVGGNFIGGTKYIIWITTGYAFNGMYLMVTNYIFYEEKTYVLFWLTLFSAALNAGLNYFLIPIYGGIGAAIATTISFFVLFVLTWVIASRIYKMPWNLITLND